MKKIYLLFIAGIFTFNLAHGQAITDTLVKQLGNAYLKNPGTVGLSIGVYVKGHTHFYNFGTTDRAKPNLPTSKTIYEIGSITKTFTGTLLANAIVEKKISLDDDIRKYLKGSYPNLEYKGTPVKIVNLVNLTSSLPNNLPDDPGLFKNVSPDDIPFVWYRQHKSYTKSKFFSDLRAAKLDTLPGARTRHSNVGAQLLGFILENIYHQTYMELLNKYITRPLKMQSTGLDSADFDQQLIIAKGYNDKGRQMPYIMKDAQGAGGLYSSTGDMINYINYQLDESNPVVKLIHTPTWGDMKTLAIGFNWQMDNNGKNHQRQLWHTGGTFGFNSYMVMYPDQQIGIVLLTNEYDNNAQARLAKIATEVYNSLP